MKKIKLIISILLIFLLLPFIVHAEVCNKEDIKIESIELKEIKGNAEETASSNNTNNQINLNTKMNVLGDSITYKVVIKNTSKSDYVFDQSQITKDYINYDITYEDDSNIVKAGEEKTIYLRLNYQEKPQIENLSNGVLTENSQVSFNLSKSNDNIINPETRNKGVISMVIILISLGLSIVLIKKYKNLTIIILIMSTFMLPQIVNAICTSTLDINLNLEIDGKEALFLPGGEVNIKMKQLAGDDTSTASNGFNFANQTITAIQYSEEEPESINKEEKNIASIPDSEYPIYMWYEDGTIYWWSEDKTPSLNEDSNFFFYGITAMNDIEGVTNWNTYNVTRMKSMFYNTSIPTLTALSKWNVENTRYMGYMFGLNNELTSLEGLEKWNTSNVTNLESTFAYCTSLTSLEGLENWNTSKITNLAYTFNFDVSLNSIDAIKNWDVSKVVNMRQLFCSNVNIEIADLSNWKTDSVEDICNLFGMWNSNGTARYDSKMKKIIFSKDFDISKVTNMSMVFSNLTLLETIEGIEYWKTPSATAMYALFSNCHTLKRIDISNFDTRNVNDFSYIFNGCSNLEIIYVGENWSTESNTNTTSLAFANSTKLPNFSTSNPNYRDLSYAHTGEGGYLTLKTN